MKQRKPEWITCTPYLLARNKLLFSNVCTEINVWHAQRRTAQYIVLQECTALQSNLVMLLLFHFSLAYVLKLVIIIENHNRSLHLD